MSESVPSDQAARTQATDIGRSVIVQAPAGSGKTTLLVERYLKLLAVVERPEEILAITFTRKAASEMATRVLLALDQAQADDDTPAGRALARSEAQGWQILEQPARLKIQTIDSLAMALTRGLPVEAGLDPSLQLVEAAEPLYAAAASRLLLRLYENGPLTDEIADFLEACDNDAARAERLLTAMLGKRDQWLEVVSSVVVAAQEDPDRVHSVLEAGLEALCELVMDAFDNALSPVERATLDELSDYAAANQQLKLEARPQRYRFFGELLTTARGDFRRTVTVKNGFPANRKTEKTEFLSLLDGLRDRGLAEQAANLRFLPDAGLSETDLQRLVNACINLALANAALTEVFSEAGVSDFTTLVLNARASLGPALAPSELALALDYRIQHLLIDEFQDTSVSQYRLFEELIRGWAPEGGNSFFAVGDPMQSIYRFRDADVSLFYRAWTRGIGDLSLEPIVLRSNFRAAPALVAWTNEAFQRVMGNQQDPVLGRIAYSDAEAARDGGEADPVRLGLYETPEDQVEGIVRAIETLLTESDGTIALLVRSRGQLTALLKRLRRRGVSWHANDIDPLLNRPVVRDLLSLVSALTEPWQRLSWFSLLRAPMFGLTLQDLTVLAEIEDFPALLEALRAGTATLTGLSPRGREPLERLASVWPERTALHELPPRSVIETLWLKLGGAEAYDDPDALTHAIRTLELIDELGSKGLIAADLEQAAAGLFAADLRESRLEILTIHKAKGLEFDHVLLPFLERTTQSDEADLLLWRSLPEGLLMGLKDLAGPFEWLARENRFRERHERQRLLYVACTRARESLTLFATAAGVADADADVTGPAAGADKPPDTAMLAQLWPFLDDGLPMTIDRVGALRVPEQTDLFETSEPVAAAERGRDLVRLEAGYRPPVFATPLLPDRLPATPADAADPIDQHVEVVLGLVVHGALERLALDTLPEGDAEIAAYLTAEEPRWKAQAEGQLPDPGAATAIAAAARQQLTGVLADPEGRRLLAARDQAAAELPVTVAGDPTPENLVIDRTFVEDNERWIIDYKTSIPPNDLPETEFLQREARRHQPQLERYGDALEALYGDRPRLALYFTALPALVTLDPDPKRAV